MADENILSLLDIAGLIVRRRSGVLTPVEQGTLESWLEADPAHSVLFEELSGQDWVGEQLAALDPVTLQASASRVYQALGMETRVVAMESHSTNMSGRRAMPRILRWTAAAAVVVSVGIGIWLGVTRKRQPNLVQTAPVMHNDLPAPVGAKTVLTLGNGKQLVLDSLGTGALAEQGNARVSKLDPHQLAYNTVGVKTAEIVYNTLSTARGGQTMVTLADGTKVWLNAESSLRFPTAFNGATREVELTGEAYFEVVHIAGKPFRVHTGKTTVEDIGTQFDVNAYSDEPDLKATLLEGAIRVNGRVLVPGEQAAVTEAGGMAVKKGIDAEEVLAWKNGEFYFQRTDMAAILRQVGRWYDVDIESPAQSAQRTFSGIVSRKSNLSDVMKIFEGVGIRFRIEGKKMILLK
jgi:transmembrane sensor